MNGSFKLIAITFFATILFLIPANAEERIYRMDDVRALGIAKNQFGIQSQKKSELKVIDSIPQLGVVLMSRVDGEKSGADDLGRNNKIVLNLPKQPRYVLPSGFWGLKTIEVDKAWPVTAGAGVIVAVSDTGVDQNHKDLKANMWVNPGEDGLDSEGNSKRTNGIDDDGNGYVDDVHGWDFLKNKAADKDNHYHGTHVAGTIAASYSNAISGVAPHTKIMNVAFLSGAGGTEFNGAKTIVYAADNGAKIINCSWGGPGESPIIKEAIKYAAKKGVLVVAAAGNSKTNIDRKIFTPAAISVENVLSVGATSGSSGKKASYSNFGSKNVDLAAPGSNIKSTAPNNGYRTLNGTSMAAPHVSGVAALLISVRPGLSPEDLKDILMESVVVKSAWKRKSQTSGVLNANNAVRMLLKDAMHLASAVY